VVGKRDFKTALIRFAAAYKDNETAFWLATAKVFNHTGTPALAAVRPVPPHSHSSPPTRRRSAIKHLDRVNDPHRIDFVLEFDIVQIRDFFARPNPHHVTLELLLSISEHEGLRPDAKAPDLAAPSQPVGAQVRNRARPFNAQRVAFKVLAFPDIYIAS
jgi:hypothetical protein